MGARRAPLPFARSPRAAGSRGGVFLRGGVEARQAGRQVGRQAGRLAGWQAGWQQLLAGSRAGSPLVGCGQRLRAMVVRVARPRRCRARVCLGSPISCCHQCQQQANGRCRCCCGVAAPGCAPRAAVRPPVAARRRRRRSSQRAGCTGPQHQAGAIGASLWRCRPMLHAAEGRTCKLFDARADRAFRRVGRAASERWWALGGAGGGEIPRHSGKSVSQRCCEKKSRRRFSKL